MNPYDEKTKRLREQMLAEGALDPVLSFEYIKADLGVGHATFHREVRPQLPVIQISPRRFGVQSSLYRTWKAARTTTGRWPDRE